MAADDRRDALVDAFVRVARREGRAPTTSEIATEAGVAEGTIYRVFASKDQLEQDAVQAAFCPGPVRRRITAVDPEGSLHDRLVAFTRIMQARFTEVFGLMGALGLTEPPNRGPHLACYEAGRHVRGPEGDAHVPVHQPLLDTVHALLVHDDDELIVPGPELVHRLRLFTFSASHPGITDGAVLTPEEIVDTVLLGLRRRDDAPTNGLTPTPRESVASSASRATRHPSHDHPAGARRPDREAPSC
jgi:AcrR family transcriptional regulator